MMLDRAYLLHIRDAVDQLLAYRKEGKEKCLTDRRTREAVIRNLEVLGEAVKNLSAEIKSRYPHVPWRQISGMRDKLIHQYFGVDLGFVWDALENRLDSLSETVDTMLKEPD